MIRRAIFLILAIAMLAMPAQAHVGRDATKVTFSGAVPCSVVCSYWVDNGFRPCENPFPPGSWVDHVTQPAPAPPAGRIMVLETALDYEVDWDGFLCANDDARTELVGGQNLICDHYSVLWLSCLHEDMSTPVAGGQTVIFRAYSWSDPLEATGHYWYLSI